MLSLLSRGYFALEAANEREKKKKETEKKETSNFIVKTIDFFNP